jgi:hypothetical protein
MKKLFFIVISVSSIQAFSACNTSLDIKLFNNPFADAKSSVKYKRVIKVLNTLGYDINHISNNPKYRTQIELGVERGDHKNTLLSHIQVTNRAGDIVFEDYRNRIVSGDAIISTDQMLQFTAKHLSRQYPLCD